MSIATAWPADLPDVEAIWKPQRIVFVYGSEGRFYPCSTLEYKIKMILRQLGARQQLEVRRCGCRDFAAQARFEVSIESPVEATLENIRDITQYSSEEELIARTRAMQLPSAAELQRFPATWKSIRFHRHRHLHLDAGDCALVQQLRQQIMPRMSIQVTKDINAADCSQARESLTAPRLVVLALLPASEPGQVSPVKRNDPSAGDQVACFRSVELRIRRHARGALPVPQFASLGESGRAIGWRQQIGGPRSMGSVVPIGDDLAALVDE